MRAYKELILLHTLLQKGEPTTLKDGFRNVEFVREIGQNVTDDTPLGYGRLVRQYSEYLTSKLHLHQQYPEFDGISSSIYDYHPINSNFWV